MLQNWQNELELFHKNHPQPWDFQTQRQFVLRFRETLEAWLDAGHGSCLMRDAKLRAIVENALLHFDRERYVLDSFVIMPNHVHAIIKPLGDHTLSNILHSWKSFTAKEINKVTQVDGQVWMEESYDTIIRHSEDLVDCRKYIHGNSKGTPAASFTLHAPHALAVCSGQAGSLSSQL
jgi:type I restriction enzyme R subunit